MKIIMLIGQNGCGKTTAIRKVYDEMLRHADVLEPKTVIYGEDFWAVLKHRSGQRIGFISASDYANDLVAGMCDFSDSDRCDILLCACNEGFSEPHRVAGQLARENFIPVYKSKEKAPENEWDAENEEYKNIIIALAVSLVNNHKLIAIL
jgi:ABC-type dipeptide/oligopeptide/nickel transport system ATPase component